MSFPIYEYYCFQFSSVIQSCSSLCDPMDCSTPGFPVHQQLSELAQTHVHWVSDTIQPSHPLSSNHLIICCLLLFLPSIFPRIRVFSNESVLRIRRPKYWRFSFNISPSNEYLELISSSIDCWISVQSKRLSRVSPTPHFKSIISSALSFLYSPTLTSIHDYWKNQSFD